MVGLSAVFLLVGCGQQATSSKSASKTKAAIQTVNAPASSTPCPATPKMAFGTPVKSDLIGLRMETTEVGWAYTRTAVLHTTDGGETWSDVTPDGVFEPLLPAEMSDLMQPPDLFVRGETAWLANPSPKGMRVLRTDDGGKTWHAGALFQTFADGFPCMAVLSSPDLHRGWALLLGDVAMGHMWIDVFRTVDGGVDWSLVSRTSGQQTGTTPQALPFMGLKNGIVFRSGTVGWITGSNETKRNPAGYRSTGQPTGVTPGHLNRWRFQPPCIPPFWHRNRLLIWEAGIWCYRWWSTNKRNTA